MSTPKALISSENWYVADSMSFSWKPADFWCERRCLVYLNYFSKGAEKEVGGRSKSEALSAGKNPADSSYRNQVS